LVSTLWNWGGKKTPNTRGVNALKKRAMTVAKKTRSGKKLAKSTGKKKWPGYAAKKKTKQIHRWLISGGKKGKDKHFLGGGHKGDTTSCKGEVSSKKK